MIIAIDFDGTIVSDAYPGIGYLMPDAKDTIERLHLEGNYIIIWTCRQGEAMIDCINYLLEHKIPFDRINRAAPDNVAQYGSGGQKVYADVYIDDKNIGGFPGWREIRNQLCDPDYMYP